MNSIFSTVKSFVTVRQAAEKYGLHLSRSGMTVCPFHEDMNPSMKVDDKRFHCFGCGADGDVISFTGRLFRLNPLDAAKKLARDFHVDVSCFDRKHSKHTKVSRSSPQRPDRGTLTEKLNKLQADAHRDNLHSWLIRARQSVTDAVSQLNRWKENFSPQTPSDDWDPRFCDACRNETYLEYLLDILFDPLEEPDRLYRSYHGEVMLIDEKYRDYDE